ncbi:uncharacterized protein Z520_09026 [Fonsecaea multimorphosa CBS 102226]|uniref:Uncharacterized protein n=1 Tax=Fonsecaea multimorphosa CBS 102226 TaxID=1442371 RepID=A0A0D2GZW7_9EURO|nr:uncharacterized protein Z520_09026 [Fonsecaea multimorphosa CBS 102226]KIX95110.1 hypothetical protein Z520_09026 [Fonsecaea multimorphosa CBS 102226]OAL20831.1 hypothetical protein AYO22_08459 [Fonsecaea multimorphosa]
MPRFPLCRRQTGDEGDEELTDEDRLHPSIKPKTDSHAAYQLRNWAAYVAEDIRRDKVTSFAVGLLNRKADAKVRMSFYLSNSAKGQKLCNEFDSTMNLFRDIANNFFFNLRHIADEVAGMDETKWNLSYYATVRARVDKAFDHFNKSVSSELDKYADSGKSQLLNTLLALEAENTGMRSDATPKASLPSSRLKGSALPAECPIPCILKRVAWPIDFLAEWEAKLQSQRDARDQLEDVFENTTQIIRPRSEW